MLFTYVASKSFSPSDIPNLALWLDASDTSTIIHTGGSVSQWNDKSGNGYNATQPTEPAKPKTGTRTVNGLNSLDFDGSANFMLLPSGLYSTPNSSNTVIAIYATDDVSTLQQLFCGRGGGMGRYGLAINQSGVNAFFQNSTSNSSVSVSMNPSDTNVHVLVGKRDATIPRNFIYFDGSIGSVEEGQSFPLSDLNIGRFPSSIRYFNGLLAELIIVNRSLTDLELNKVSEYSNAKWGSNSKIISNPVFSIGTSMVSFGDSITVGEAASSTSLSWSALLAAYTSMVELNKGISGTILQNSPVAGGNPQPNNGRDRYVADLTGANKRDVCVIDYGFNDLRYTAAPSSVNLANYINDFQEIITGLIAAGYTTEEIIICSPYWIADIGYSTGTTGFTGSNRTVHESYVAAVRDLALANNVFYADVYAAMRDNGGASLISADNIHPNTAGHQVIFNSILNARKVS